MIHTNALLIAESAVIDRMSNRLSIFNSLEQVRTPAYPAIVPNVVIVAIIEREDSDEQNPRATLRIRFNEDVMWEGDLEVNFNGERLTRAINNFQGMLIPGPGVLRVELQIGEDIATSYGIRAFPPSQAIMPVDSTRPVAHTAVGRFTPGALASLGGPLGRPEFV